MRNQKTKDMILSAMFVALISVGAFIKIPIPVVPFTLQYLFTMLAGLLLGKRRGSLAVCVYVALGLMGLPSLPREVDSATSFSQALATSLDLP